MVESAREQALFECVSRLAAPLRQQELSIEWRVQVDIRFVVARL